MAYARPAGARTPLRHLRRRSGCGVVDVTRASPMCSVLERREERPSRQRWFRLMANRGPFPWWRRVEVGTLTVSPFGGRLVCHLCRRSFHKLALHAWRYHHMSAAEDRQRFGLPPGTPLVSEFCRSTHAKAGRESPLTAQRAPEILILDDEAKNCCRCDTPARRHGMWVRRRPTVTEVSSFSSFPTVALGRRTYFPVAGRRHICALASYGHSVTVIASYMADQSESRRPRLA